MAHQRVASSGILFSWLQNLGAMVAHGTEIRVICSECGAFADVDLAKLLAAKGSSYSLINRRCRCRLTEGCRGWNRFYYRHGVFIPLWTDEATNRWLKW